MMKEWDAVDHLRMIATDAGGIWDLGGEDRDAIATILRRLHRAGAILCRETCTCEDAAHFETDVEAMDLQHHAADCGWQTACEEVLAL